MRGKSAIAMLIYNLRFLLDNVPPETYVEFAKSANQTELLVDHRSRVDDGCQIK